MNMLTNLSTLEISNVKKAANRKRYAISKSEKEKTMDIKQVIAVAAEGETEFVATLKSAGASPERIEAETALYRIKKNCADVLPTAKKDDETDDEEQGEKESDEAYKARAKKSGFTPKMKAKKSADAESNMDAKVEALFKGMSDKIAALEVSNQELVAKSEMQIAIAKAEKFSCVPMAPEKLAVVLKSASPEVIEMLERVNETVAKSAMMNPIGSVGANGGGSAWTKIETLAKNLTMKADSGKEMSQEQKVSHVISKTAEGRELYAQYNEEKRQALKRV